MFQRPLLPLLILAVGLNACRIAKTTRDRYAGWHFYAETVLLEELTNVSRDFSEDALKAEHAAGVFTDLEVTPSWALSAGYAGGPFLSIEVLQGVAVIVEPRWPEGATLAQQYALLGLDEEPAFVGELRRTVAHPKLPASERLYAIPNSEDAPRFFTRTGDHIDRVMEVHRVSRGYAHDLHRASEGYEVPEVTQERDLWIALTDVAGEWGNKEAALYVLHDKAKARWQALDPQLTEKQHAQEEAVGRAQEEREVAARAAEAQKLAEQNAQRAQQLARARADRQRIAELLDAPPPADVADHVKQRAELTQLFDTQRAELLEAADQAAIQALLPRLTANDAALRRKLATEIAAAQRDGRMGTASTFRYIDRALSGAPALELMDVAEAARSDGADGRREAARLALEVIPTCRINGTPTWCGESWNRVAGSHRLSFLAPGAVVKASGARTPWDITLGPENRTFAANPRAGQVETTTRANTSPRIQEWKSQLHVLRGKVDFAEAALKGAMGLVGSSSGGGGPSADWGYHQETITLGTGKEQTRITVARRNTSSPSPSGASYGQELIDEKRRDLDAAIDAFHALLDRPPEALEVSTSTVQGAGAVTAVERVVTLVIDGRTRQTTQRLPWTADFEARPNQPAVVMNAELFGQLRTESVAAARAALTQHLERRGARWAAKDRALEAALLDWIVVGDQLNPLTLEARTFVPFAWPRLD